MYSFPNLKPVCCPCPVLTVASWPAYRFPSGLVFPSLLEFSSLLWSTQSKTFSMVNEAEIDVFLKFPCLFCDPADVGNLMLVLLPFLNPAYTSGSSQFTYCWSLAWRILIITLLACEMSAVVWTFFGIVLLRDWNENWAFPVLWPLLSFPNLLAYWV